MKLQMTIALLLMPLIGCETSPYIIEESVIRITNSHPGHSTYQVTGICKNRADAHKRSVQDASTNPRQSVALQATARLLAGLSSNSKQVYKDCLLEFGFEYTTRQVPNPNYRPQHGQGTYTYANGKYVGGFKNGNPYGQGTMTFNNGEKYVGEWKDSNQHGQGTMTTPDGVKYVGGFKNGNPHGQGTVTTPDGHKYEGGFKNGNPHGQGTRTLPDGEKYVGEWKDSEWHGQGTLTRADGTKIVGQWKDGEPIK